MRCADCDNTDRFVALVAGEVTIEAERSPRPPGPLDLENYPQEIVDTDLTAHRYWCAECHSFDLRPGR